jgi:hypothetical protein
MGAAPVPKLLGFAARLGGGPKRSSWPVSYRSGTRPGTPDLSIESASSAELNPRRDLDTHPPDSGTRMRAASSKGVSTATR